MLIAIEGMDMSGKTTLFRALRSLPELRRTAIGVTFVPTMPLPRELWPAMHHVEVRQLALWDALYDPVKLYVCDRHVAVSAPVYDALHGRPMLVDIGPWVHRICVVYLEVPYETVQARYVTRGDQYFDPSKYAETKRLYTSVLARFECIRLDGREPVERLVRATLDAIASWR
jgi:thymidylate kinase